MPPRASPKRLHTHSRSVRRWLSQIASPPLPLSTLTSSPFTDAFKGMIVRGDYRDDPAQRSTAALLSRVSSDVEAYVSNPQPSQGLVSSLVPRIFAPPPPPPPLGAYIWSNMPGCGKTMLADVMFHSVSGTRKRRDHFHSFTLDIHARLHHQRSANGSSSDKLANIADDLAAEFQLLVVDEFQVTDISDAVIVHQLFRKLFANGIILVATSNRPPEGLYANGLQRDLFTPLIPILRSHCEVHEMTAERDYRLSHVSGAISSTYFLDSDNGLLKAVQKFELLVSGFPVEEVALPVLGRTLYLRHAVPQKRVVMMTFDELCQSPLSQADYVALVSAYHTIVLTGVPVLDAIMDRNAVRRFTTFVDYAYEARAKLIVHAEAPPSLLVKGQVTQGSAAATEEQFASARMVSRLIEIQTSDEYLAAPWTPPALSFASV